MNNIENIIKDILKSNNFKFEIMVPSKSLLCLYKEEQNLYGLSKKIVVTNNHHNISFTISANFRNDYFESSNIEFKLTKPIVEQNKILQQILIIEPLYTGKNEDTEILFKKLKNEFYDKNIKFPVPPKM